MELRIYEFQRSRRREPVHSIGKKNVSNAILSKRFFSWLYWWGWKDTGIFFGWMMLLQMEPSLRELSSWECWGSECTLRRSIRMSVLIESPKMKRMSYLRWCCFRRISFHPTIFNDMHLRPCPLHQWRDWDSNNNMEAGGICHCDLDVFSCILSYQFLCYLRLVDEMCSAALCGCFGWLLFHFMSASLVMLKKECFWWLSLHLELVMIFMIQWFFCWYFHTIICFYLQHYFDYYWLQL